MLQAGSDHGHVASSLSLVSGQDQFNPSNPRKSNSACSGKDQQQAGRQTGRQAMLATPSHGPVQPPVAPVQLDWSLARVGVRPGLLWLHPAHHWLSAGRLLPRASPSRANQHPRTQTRAHTLPLALLHASLGAPARKNPALCRQRWAVVPWSGEDQDPSLGAARTQAGGSPGCQGLAAATIMPKSPGWHG